MKISIASFLGRGAAWALLIGAGSAVLSGCGGKEEFATNNNVANTTSDAGSPTTQTPVEEPASKPGKYGGTLTDVTISDPKTFNYWVAGETSSTGVVGPLYDTLIIRNSYTLKWEDGLADLPKISKDGKTWTFQLKPDLKWSDGRPLTADDVMFTLKMIYDPKTQGIMREGMLVDVVDPATKKIKRVPLQYRKIDARTIEFKFPQPYAPARDMLSFPVAPRHKLEAAYNAGRINTTWGVDTDLSELVSSGAWVLKSYVQGQRVVYGRNPHYWKKDDKGRPLPYFDKYVQLIVPDVNTMTLKFQSGESDILGVQAPDYPLIKKGESKGNYQVLDLGSGWGFSYLGFNMNPNSKVDKQKIKLFQNVKFRQAVSYAINREQMCKNLFLGFAKPLYTPETPANKIFFNANAPSYAFDPDKAKSMLDEIGVKDNNGNGMREFEGKEVKFNIITNVENNVRKSMCVAITADLKKIGVNASFTPISFNKLVANLDSAPYNWEACVLGFTGGPEPHNGANIWFSSGPSHQWWPKQKEPATPWEAEIDKLFREGAQTLDEAKRKEIYDRYQVIAAENLPFVFTVVPNQLMAVRNRFGNLKPSPSGGVLWNMDEIYDLSATRDKP